MTAWATRAEALGFDSVWISDHLFLDIARYGAPPGPRGTVEPFTALAGLAALTERVRLGTLVACAPLRHPAIVAKMATTIDLVSDGRFDLGLGAGWYEPEFRAFGYPFGTVGERFRGLEEAVEAIAALFAGDGPVSFEGSTVQPGRRVQPSAAGATGRAADLARWQGRRPVAPAGGPARRWVERLVARDAWRARGTRGGAGSGVRGRRA